MMIRFVVFFGTGVVLHFLVVLSDFAVENHVHIAVAGGVTYCRDVEVVS